MYRGATRINLDGKNRIAIPTKYREKILIESSGLLVLTAHIYKCLLLYPQFAWEPIQEKIMNLSSFEKKSSGLQRLLVGFAEDITLDKANRFLIPAELKNYAEIDKNAIFFIKYINVLLRRLFQFHLMRDYIILDRLFFRQTNRIY